MVAASLALAVRFVRVLDGAMVWPKNLVGPFEMLLVVPSTRWKVRFGTMEPFSRTMDTHFEGFRWREMLLQALSMSRSADWWSSWVDVMIDISSAKAVILCSLPRVYFKDFG